MGKRKCYLIRPIDEQPKFKETLGIKKRNEKVVIKKITREDKRITCKACKHWCAYVTYAMIGRCKNTMHDCHAMQKVCSNFKKRRVNEE